MTDEQIIKALECCITNDCAKCKAYDETNGEIVDCLHAICRNALDLINRKDAEVERLNNELVSADEVIGFREAEIERLQAENTDLKKAIETMTNEHIKWGFEAKKRIENARSEAYKELAVEFVDDLSHMLTYDKDYIKAKIFHLVETKQKELTEGGNEEPPQNDFKE